MMKTSVLIGFLLASSGAVAQPQVCRDCALADPDYQLPAHLGFCLGDVNQDGELETTDFGAWLAAFNAGDPLGDQNMDGVFDPTDFGAWLDNINDGLTGLGCPRRLDGSVMQPGDIIVELYSHSGCQGGSGFITDRGICFDKLNPDLQGFIAIAIPFKRCEPIDNNMGTQGVRWQWGFTATSPTSAPYESVTWNSIFLTNISPEGYRTHIDISRWEDVGECVGCPGGSEGFTSPISVFDGFQDYINQPFPTFLDATPGGPVVELDFEEEPAGFTPSDPADCLSCIDMSNLADYGNYAAYFARYRVYMPSGFDPASLDQNCVSTPPAKSQWIISTSLLEI